jgi:hypothetical protein
MPQCAFPVNRPTRSMTFRKSCTQSTRDCAASVLWGTDGGRPAGGPNRGPSIGCGESFLEGEAQTTKRLHRDGPDQHCVPVDDLQTSVARCDSRQRALIQRSDCQGGYDLLDALVAEEFRQQHGSFVKVASS